MGNRVKKVMILQPPAVTIKGERKICQVPLGLGYIGANIGEEYEVKILDAIVEDYNHETPMGEEYLIFGMSFAKIREEIVGFKPDMVGISMQSTAFYLNGLALAKLVKYIDKDLIVTVGGAYPSADYKKVIQSEYIDYILLGEGESSFNQLLAALNEKLPFEQVDGLVYKDSGNVKINKKIKYIEDLDSLKSPFTKITDLSKYFEINSTHFVTKTPRATHMITSRGCPNDCNFCTIHDVWGYRYRMRSAKNVLSEVEMLKKNYDITELQFEDDNLAYNKNRAIDIFKGLREYDLQWGLPNGISLKTLDDDLLKLMKESGCYTMAIPFESASQKVLKQIIHKQVDLNYGKHIVKEADRLGIETYGFFIVGFPGETLEDIKETLTFSAELNLTGVYLFYATPFPGTKLLEDVLEQNYLSKNQEMHRLTIERPSYSTNDFTIQQITDLVEEFKSKKNAEGYNYL